MKTTRPLPLPSNLLELSVRDRLDDVPYMKAYPILTDVIRSQPMSAVAFVRAAHLVYAWMPTVLLLHSRIPPHDFTSEAALVERIRNHGPALTEVELQALASCLTESQGSVIGLSKLLHFANPDRYAIWDTRVYAFLRYGPSPVPIPRPAYADVSNVGRYLEYTRNVDNLCAAICPELAAFHARANAYLAAHGIHQPVSLRRAIDMVMFSQAPDFRRRDRRV